METINITNTKAKITADEPTILSFDKARSYIHIRNDGSDTAYAALGAVEELTDTADGVISVPAGGSTRLDAELPPLPPVICTVKGSVSVILSNADSCPFRFTQRGGDGYADVTATGNPVQLDGLQGGVPFSEITVSGKNLLKYPYMTESGKVTSGVTFTSNSDGSITLNGTSTAYGSFNFTSRLTKDLLLNGTYTLSGATADAKLAINATRDGKATTIIRTQSSSIFTTSYHDNDNEYGFAVFVEFDAGKTFDNLTIFPQIELGTTATDYEPPIIGREIALSACGKNLADFADVGGKTVSGTTIAYDSDNGYIVLNGTATAQIYIGIKVHLVAGTYTVSGAAASNVRLVLRNKAWVNIADAITNATITVTSDDYYVHIAVPKGTVCDNVIFRPQIELGDTATDYEPYHGSTVTITPDSNPYIVSNDIRQQDGHNVISVSDGTLSVTGCKSNMAVKRIWDKLDELATAIIVANGETE